MAAAALQDNIQACILLVTRNQTSLLPELLDELNPLGLPILVVDNRSNKKNLAELEQLVSQHDLELLRLLQKHGKGVATRVGIDEALRLGYTHVLIHDIDVLYSTDDIQAMLEVATQSPDTLFYSASPVNTSPSLKTSSSKISTSHKLAATTAFTPGLREYMRGLCLFPTKQTYGLLKRYPCGKGAEFKLELMIRWCWRGLPSSPYNIRAIRRPKQRNTPRENFLLLKMHLQTLLGMVIRLPWLVHVRRTAAKEQHPTEP